MYLSYPNRKKLETEGDNPKLRDALPLKSKLADMTFRMDLDWHTKFKQAAAEQRISMKELLIQCFELYLKKRDRK